METSEYHKQSSSCITTKEQLQRYIQLKPIEKAIFEKYPETHLKISSYYLNVIQQSEALRKTMIPSLEEYIHSKEESSDPLCEDECRPVEGIIHRYPDRVLFLVTDQCFANCRYCTRSRIVHSVSSNQESLFERWQEALLYIQDHVEIRDVLLSGGDPLTCLDTQLEWILFELRKIKHVEIIRLGTKAPIVYPQRITPELVAMLKKYHPLYMSIHVTHAAELTKEVSLACQLLADGGIPLGSQTVLLKGVNDTVPIMRELMVGLLKMRVRPYYVYQCDPILGSAHFRTSIKTGLDIIQGLRGHITGYGVPQYVIDAPGGGGKIPLLPEYVIGWEGNRLRLRNYQGKEYSYNDTLKI